MTEFKDVAEGIQSIITSIGIVVAGGWALFTFRDLGARQKARLDIAESEQRLIEQPVLNIEISIEILNQAGCDEQKTIAKVLLRNDGRRGVAIYDLSLQLLSIGGNNSRSMKAIIVNNDGDLVEFERRFLRPGQFRTLVFDLDPVPSGLHIVQVNLTYDGFVLNEGDIVYSNDVPIYSFEQAIINVS